jgi:hypothetical protein
VVVLRLGVVGDGDGGWKRWARAPTRPLPLPLPSPIGDIGVAVIGGSGAGNVGGGAGGATFCFFAGVGEGGVGGEWCAAGGGLGVAVADCVCVVLLHTSFCGGEREDSSSMLSSRAAKVLEVGLGGSGGWEGVSLSFFLSKFFLYIREGLLKYRDEEGIRRRDVFRRTTRQLRFAGGGGSGGFVCGC